MKVSSIWRTFRLHISVTWINKLELSKFKFFSIFRAFSFDFKSRKSRETNQKQKKVRSIWIFNEQQNKLMIVAITRKLYNVSCLVLVALCDAPFDSSLLSSNKLRVDALWRFLSAHSVGFRFHIRTKAHKMAYSIRLECACSVFNSLRNASKVFQRRSRPDIVSFHETRVQEHYDVNENFRCWMNESPYTNVLVAPVCLSMLLNLLFLCNIVRVVLLKLRAPASMSNGPGNGPSRNILQAFR